MSFYKVLLVDDEEEVRQAIAKKLDWAALGFAVVGEASNGEEALDLCEQLLPDVVMTDIKMPFMDGMELCRRLKITLPGVKVAIFSGFDEFEYAKEAISLEVEEYVLKPVDAQELARVFGRIRQSLDNEIAERRNVERLQKYYEESLPLMRQQVLSSLLLGGVGPRRIAELSREYGLDLDAMAFCAALVRTELREETADEAGRLLSFSLRQLLKEELEPCFRVYLVPMPDGIGLLFLLNAGQTPKALGETLDRIFPKAQKLLDIRFSAGIGDICTKPGDIARSYAEAKSALEYQVLTEPGHSVFIADIEPGAEEDELRDPTYMEEVLRQIKIGRAEDLEDAVGALVGEMKRVAPSAHQYQLFLLEMTTELLRLVRAYRLEARQSRLVEAVQPGVQFSNLDEMGRWLLSICEGLRGQIRAERKDTTRAMVESAKAYTAGHYTDCELSAEQLAAELKLSPAYFSTVFKRETGLGFVSYLTGLRMEKALEELMSSDEKTYIIAEKVGYSDPNYFSYVFKKQFGVSPSKYRSDRLGAHETSS